MSATGIFLILAAVGLTVWLIHHRFIRPLNRIREDIRQLSGGNFQLPVLDSEPSTYQATAQHIRKIAERRCRGATIALVDLTRI